MQVFCPHIVTNLLCFLYKIVFLLFIHKLFTRSHGNIAMPCPYDILYSKSWRLFMGDLSNCGCNDCNARSNNGCGCNNGCNNGCGSGFGGGNSMWWIIILLFFCGGCGGNGGFGGLGSNNGCGCDDNNNGCCSSIIWIILLSCICGNGSIF